MSRLNFHLGQVVFEVEGEDALVREGLTFIKEHFPLAGIGALLTTEEAHVPPPTPKVDGRTEIEGDSGEADVDIRDFYSSRQPKNDMQRVVVLAQYAKEFRGLDEVSEKEVLPLFHEAGDRKLPGNLGNTLRNAARKNYGWMESVNGKRGYYRLTNAGYRLVHHDLMPK